MIRRHKKKRVQEEVTLNLAAMLDMAFQLLAFFILTFKPSPAEAEVTLNLPDPRLGSIVRPGDPLDPHEFGGKETARTLTVTIASTQNGQVASVSVGLQTLFDGPLDPAQLRQLDHRLKEIFAIQGEPFDQVLVRVGKRLHYGELMKVIDVCTRQKMADGTAVGKISFVEVPEN